MIEIKKLTELVTSFISNDDERFLITTAVPNASNTFTVSESNKIMQKHFHVKTGISVGFLPVIYVKYQLNSILNLTSKWN